MMKKLLAMVIAALFVLSAFPAVNAAASTPAYPSVKADKTTVKTNQAVNFHIVTSNRVVKLQTLIDGSAGSTYTKYTEKEGLRYWDASIKFTKAGNRKVQYKAFMTSGSKVVIPGKPVYVKVTENSGVQIPEGAVVTGQKAVFTVTTPSSVTSIRYYIDGRAYSKTSKYATNSGGMKTWSVPITFLVPGTRKIQFSSYNTKGSALKKFPSTPVKVTVSDGAPVINYFKMKDWAVVPSLEGNPKFYIDVYNQSNITVKIFDSDGKDVETLVFNKKTTGRLTYTWSVMDANKNLKFPLGTYTAKMHAQNSAGEKDMSVEFALAEAQTPQVKTDSVFVVDYDIVSLKGALMDDGNVAVSDAGFYYGTFAENLDKKVSCGKVYEGDSFKKLLSRLSGNTTYYFQAYAVNISGKKGVGEILSFTTPAKGDWDVDDSFMKSVEDEYLYLFNTSGKKYYNKASPPIGYANSSEAALHMKYVTVPVWKIVDGKYVASTQKLRVHRKMVAPVKAIFADIFALPKKFPIRSTHSQYFRTIKGPNASSTLSNHSFGCAIDINASNNPHVRSGDPRSKTSPYTIPKEVVDIFIAYGWDWGGYFTSSKDYMHFEYLGTPLATKVWPPPAPEPSPSPSPSAEPSPSPEPSPSQEPSSSPS